MLVFQLAANGNPQSLWSAPDLFAAAPSRATPLVEDEMADDALRVGDLFARDPVQWGLRGDPYVWAAMGEKLADVPMPSDWSDLQVLLRTTFRHVVGVEPDESAPDTVYLESFAHGGISSGTVHIPTWRDRLIPILIDRSLLR